jgi:predicted enzyme related to lactoylglutathione lyase
MLNFNSILVFSENPKELAEFYSKVFDKKFDMEMEGYYGFEVGAAWITIGPHDKVHGKNSTPERVMWNFETRDIKGEFERIKATGAKVVKEPTDDAEGAIATFEDPDGNYFQLMPPFEDMAN